MKKSFLLALAITLVGFVACSDEESYESKSNSKDLGSSKEKVYEINPSAPDFVNESFISFAIKYEIAKLEEGGNNSFSAYLDKDNNLVVKSQVLEETPQTPSIKTDNKEAFYAWHKQMIEDGWVVTTYFDEKTGYYYGWTSAKPK